jgi:hypothetical protein
MLLAHPAKLEGAYDLACDGWLAGCPSTSEPFAFKGPSNILQRVLNSLILQRDPLSFKGRKRAILTLNFDTFAQ